jgi:hypothetical protein
LLVETETKGGEVEEIAITLGVKNWQTEEQHLVEVTLKA